MPKFAKAIFSLACGLAVVVGMPAAGQTLEWVKQFGTSSNDYTGSVALDEQGRVYISGKTLAAPEFSVFVSQFEANGQHNWTRRITDAGHISGGFMAADTLGNSYLLGDSFFDVSLNGFELRDYGERDVFIAKHDANGIPLWIRQLSGSANDISNGIAIDPLGNVVVTGSTASDLDGPHAGSNDAFLAKYNANGNLLWTRQFGTPEEEEPFAISTDGWGNVYVTGRTRGALGGDNAGLTDAFLTKYDEGGTHEWTRQFGTTGFDSGTTLWIDNEGKVFLGGSTGGDEGGQFLRKYGSDGALEWSRIAIAEHASLTSLTGDNSGMLFGASVTFPWDNFESYDSSLFDVSLTSFSAESGERQWSAQLATDEQDQVYSVVADTSGNVYLAGNTDGVLGEMSFGRRDVFLAKFSYPLPGDFNHDGLVDARDYNVWRNGLGTEYTTGDYDLWKANYGRGTAAALQLTSVPEPPTATLALLLVGLMAHAAHSHRPRKFL